jgi:hypothetical protein
MFRPWSGVGTFAGSGLLPDRNQKHDFKDSLVAVNAAAGK